MRFLQSFVGTACVVLASFAFANSDSPYQLSFANVDGEEVSLSEYQGKVVLLNFWATWCPPCIKEMPSLQRLKEQMQGKPFEVIAVNLGEDSVTVSSFLMELDAEFSFPVLMDEQGNSFGDLGLRALPTTILFDRNGRIVNKVLGDREWDSKEWQQEINSLIESEAGS